MIIKQISIFMENTTGRLADVTALLAQAGINLRAISIADTTDFGILRLVADQPELALRRLKHAGFAARESEVIGVEVPDHPGGLARIIALLRDGLKNAKRTRHVQEINGDKKYKLIINATALIDADSTLNITPAVLAKVNELYAADKKAAKK